MPINQFILGITENAPVAQLDRATDFESVGRTFEPCRAHVFYPLLFFKRFLLLITGQVFYIQQPFLLKTFPFK